MDSANLDLKWKEMMNSVFESFVEMYTGVDAEGRPACFGTGDGHVYCVHCPYDNVC